MMPEMKTLNGYEVVDAKARQDIEDIMSANLASEEYVDEAIAAIPKPDYTGLATEAYVDNAIDNIPEVDLSKHALKSEVPTKVSQLQNDSKFITRDEVPETDLSEYAKKSEIPDVSDFITNIPSEYITESELNAKGYLTQHQDLSSYAKKSEVPDISGKADKNHTHSQYLTEHQDISHLAPKSSIPTKVSQLANDSNYLTSIPSTYITEAELEAKNYLTEHQSLAAYATKTYVDNTVAENQPNLSAYAKKSDIPDVSDFISEIPSEYVTDSELAAKKYATESYVGEAIAQAQLSGEEIDLSDYAKKADVPTKTSQLTNDSNFLTAIPSEYVTDTELNNKGYLTEHQDISGKADKNHTHTEYADAEAFTQFQMDMSTAMANHTHAQYANKNHTHDEYLTEHQSLAGYATEKYVDDAVAGIDIPTPDNVVYLDISNIGTAYEPASEEAITLAKDLIAGKPLMVYLKTSATESRQADIKCGADYVELNAAPVINSNTGDVTQCLCSISNFGSDGAEDWKAYKASSTRPALVTPDELNTALTDYATEEYVDNAVSEISGKETIEIPYNGTTFPTAMTDKLKEIWQYGVDGKNILDKYEIYLVQNSGNYRNYYIVNSASCDGSATSTNTYKRLKLSVLRDSANLLTCTYAPYTGTLYVDLAENIVERSQLEQLPTWYHANSTDNNYCRWNFNGSARMVKLVGRVSDETSHYATFEIASPNDSPISSYTYHQVPNTLGVKSTETRNTYNFLQVLFSGDYFELQNPDGVNCSDYILPEGMYYMV